MTREELLKDAKPILFDTEMVKAILEGRKTVTRRLVKPQPEVQLRYSFAGYGHGKWHEVEKPFGKQWTPPCHGDDILYVRETWNHYSYDNLFSGEHREGYFYKASPEMKSTLPDYVQYHWGKKWCPSIHMPKEAARIFLKVKFVKVERLQDITAEGALSEGTQQYIHLDGSLDEQATRTAFIGIWNSTIKKSDPALYGWDANPYVWVIEFERIEVE